MVSLLDDKINLTYGVIVALLSYIFGEHWFLFAFFIFLNVSDYATRWIAARINGTECSKSAWVGVLKKIGYWIMIAMAFGMSAVFVRIGQIIGVDLQVTTLIGWFVLATLITNEIRSILENLYEANCKIPKILVKGLAVANKALDKAIKIDEEDEEILDNDSDD